MSVNVLDFFGHVCTCGVCMCAFSNICVVCVYIYVCIMCMFKHMCVVCMCVQTGMCMCVYIHVSPRLTLGLFPTHSSPYGDRLSSWSWRLLLQGGWQASPRQGFRLHFPCVGLTGRPAPLQFSHGFWRLEHRSSHRSNTLPSKRLPRAMFCFVWSSVYAVLYHLTHDFSHETNNLTHHAFFPLKVFRHFP